MSGRWQIPSAPVTSRWISKQGISVWLHGRKIGYFRADLVVADAVILELKARPNLERQHEAQLLDLLRATRFEVGLLLNFGPQPQLKRLIFSNKRKQGP